MKKIPSIHQPIQRPDGSMEYVWYLFLQWVSENAGTVDLSDYFTKEETEALLAVKANTDDLADVAFSGSYNDLSNKPTIPTVGDGIITVKQGGVTKGTFTVNQSGDTEINIDEGGSGIDNLTITKNTDDEMQAVAVIDQNTGIVKTWTGTAAEYDAIVTKDPDTEYIIIDDIGGSATEIGEITEDINELKTHEVIAFQAPTAQNNYTWYRKYADGWVEQGGMGPSVAPGAQATINFPVTMTDTNYTLLFGLSNAGAKIVAAITRTASSATVESYAAAGTASVTVNWEVKGMAA